MGLRIAISVSNLSVREMESDSDGRNREERPRSAASQEDLLGAARRAVRSRLEQAGCAWLTEETTGSRAPWRAAARELR